MTQSYHSKKIIIAIDGPSASGKGTIARGIAAHFGYSHLDTGLLYRAVGFKTFEQDPNLSELVAIRMAQAFDVSWLDNLFLRTDTCSAYASKVAVMGKVRTALLDFQRQFAVHPPLAGAVLDGRDIGSVICPKAPIKFFITADVAVRAKRRFEELSGRGEVTDYDTVLADLEARDLRDSSRKDAPLKKMPDSLLLDTSKMSIKEAIEQAICLIESALVSRDSAEKQAFICV